MSSFSSYGCPSSWWTAGTIIFFLTTVTFVTLFLLQKYMPNRLLGPYGLKGPCTQQTDCIDGLTCVVDATTNEGMCLCGAVSNGGTL